MATSRLFTVTTCLTVGAVGAWGVKALVIAIAGGLDRSPLEGPLFLLGLVLYIAGVIAIGWALTSGRSGQARALGAGAAFVMGAVLFVLVDAAVAGMAPDDPHWVWEEAQLWIASTATVLAWFALRGRDVAAPRAMPSSA